MAEPKKVGAMIDVPVPETKINLADVGVDPTITGAYEDYMRARQDYIKSLEERYAQPNWFKIAAGFAKPQLGGFLASLGSAAEAMGENVEQARAIQPTIAMMRAEIARGTVGLEQQRKAQAEAAEIARTGKVTPAGAANIARLTGAPTTVPTAAEEVGGRQFTRFAEALRIAKDRQELEDQFGKPFVDQMLATFSSFGIANPFDPATGQRTIPVGQVPTAGAVPAAAPAVAPAATPAGGLPSGAAVTGAPGAAELPAATQRALSKAEQASKIERVNETQKTVTQQAQQGSTIFKHANTIYQIASDPELNQAFGAFEQGDLASIIGQALEKQQISSVLGGARDYVTQSKLGQEPKKRLISKLQTLEGALSGLQTDMQQGIVNPTDVRTSLEAASIPGRRNQQDSFLRLMAMLASDGLLKYETAQAFDQVKKKPGFDIDQWTTSPEFVQTQEAAKKRRTALALNPAVSEKGVPLGMPDFMVRGLQESAVKPEKKSPGSLTLEDIQKERERRAKAKQQP